MKKIERNFSRMKSRLINKIQPALESYGIEKETIVDAIEKSLMERNADESKIQPWLLSLILWKIFDDKCFLLINPRTPAGNAVSFDVLAAAHVMWREAQEIAATRGLDDVDAAEALIRIVNIVADRLAHGKCAPIRNISNYLFTGYLNELTKYAAQIGNVYIHEVNPRVSSSDNGAFLDKIEKLILRDEILEKLPDREKEAAALHYFMGYSCKETATIMGLSDSAVRMILTRGIRKHAGSVCGNRKRHVAPKRSTQKKGGHK